MTCKSSVCHAARLVCRANYKSHVRVIRSTISSLTQLVANQRELPGFVSTLTAECDGRLPSPESVAVERALERAALAPARFFQHGALAKCAGMADAQVS